MKTEQQYKQIVDTVRELSGSKPLNFDRELQVKLSPHSQPINISNVQISPPSVIYLFDGEHWNDLKTDQVNADTIIAALFQRVTYMLMLKLKTA